MHNKSIFRKQMILYMGILLLSFGMLGTTLSVVFSEYYISQKENQLIEQGQRLAKQYAKARLTGHVDDELNYDMQILSEYMGASVFLLDQDGVIYVVSPEISQSWVGQTITDDAIKGVLDGKIVTVQGKVNGMFAESVLTVGYPIMIRDKSLGGIFMCSSMPEIEKNISGMYKAGLVCMFISMVVSAILVYFSSRKISTPLLKMNDAAKVIASGNFENRIHIESTDEIGQLANSFNNMAESLYEHEKVRRDFVANISHDLRSPLTSIQGFLNAIIDGTVPKEKEEHYLNIILEETQRLVKLTNNIVDMSKAQTSTITLEKTELDINDLIRDSLEKIQPRFTEKGISATLIFAESKTIVLADYEKIQRVFQNLVDNALKFTDKDGKIEIETTIMKEKNKVYVIVRDNGKGISEEEQKYIFDRFYKADTSRGEDKKGGGLGLSIAKEFIKAHDEYIDVKSKQGEGAEFIFSLTLSK